MSEAQRLIADLENIGKVSNLLLKAYSQKRCIAFFGDLGAGKTSLIKNMCTLLKVKDDVSSPTFSLVNEYHTHKNSRVYHFDFYRINSLEEAYDIGAEEYFESGHYCFIEWPEKIKDLLPEDCLEVHIKLINDKREYTIID